MKALENLIIMSLAFIMTACGGDPVVQTGPDPEINPEEGLEKGLMVMANELYLSPVYVRKGRTVDFTVQVYNKTSSAQNVLVELDLPESVRIVSEEATQALAIPRVTNRKLTWSIVSDAVGEVEIGVRVRNATQFSKEAFTVDFQEPLEVTSPSYIPEPQAADTGDILVGAIRCPLWYAGPAGLPVCWNFYKTEYSDRMPVLGTYNENNPEVIDWEIKYAVEHGISFMVDCWFRNKDNAGQKEIVGFLDHWSRRYGEARFCDRMDIAIMWENSNTSASSVDPQNPKQDFLENLVPYWIENYFGKEYYLKVDGNKPFFGIYNFKKFIGDLGSVAEAADAIAQMRELVKAAGFDDVFLFTSYVESPSNVAELSQVKQLGIDVLTSYHMITFTGQVNVAAKPSQGTLINTQEAFWLLAKNSSGMDNYYPTVSMGWNSTPWGGSPVVDWVLYPDNFGDACYKAKNYVNKSSNIAYGPKIVMIDNWNEFGEGHYISPTQKWGFRHLDAIREVFATQQSPHTDIVPQDIGRGPYDYPIGE